MKTLIKETPTQIKARKSFNYACKQASKCRHDLCQHSCFGCPSRFECDIQERLERARAKMA
jgi:hypothetical protein